MSYLLNIFTCENAVQLLWDEHSNLTWCIFFGHSFFSVKSVCKCVPLFSYVLGGKVWDEPFASFHPFPSLFPFVAIVLLPGSGMCACVCVCTRACVWTEMWAHRFICVLGVCGILAPSTWCGQLCHEIKVALMNSLPVCAETRRAS